MVPWGHRKPQPWNWERGKLEPRFRDLAARLQILIPAWTNIGPSTYIEDLLRPSIRPTTADGTWNMVMEAGGLAYNLDTAGKRAKMPGGDLWKDANKQRRITFLYYIVPRNHFTPAGQPARVFFWGSNSDGCFLGYDTANQKLNLRITTAATDVSINGANNSAPFDTPTVGIGTYDGDDGNMFLYQDGVEIATSAQSGLMNTPDDLYTIFNTFGGTNRSFPGSIMLLAGWDRSLTQTEVTLVSNDPYGLIRQERRGGATAFQKDIITGSSTVSFER